MTTPSGYARTRALVLGAGVGVIVVTAAVMLVRGVDTTEVIGTLLFVPVFVAFVLADLRGGLIAGVLAAIAYALLRLPAIEAVGAGRFTGLIASRAVAYLAFGLIGGLANRQLAASLFKLELYDTVDDATGLGNARFLVDDVELETSRSQRYRTIFSVAIVDLPGAALDNLPRRKRDALLRDLGTLLRDGLRTVDRPVHARDGERHRLAVVLPETGKEGANIFATRLAARIGDYLEQRGTGVDRAKVKTKAITFPDDGEKAVARLREDFARIDRAQHPGAAGSTNR